MTNLAAAAARGAAANPDSSVCVNPMEPWSAGKIVNVMVRRFR
jgi:hypothetical protein